MSLRIKKQTQRLLKESKNEKWKKYEKRKETNSSLNRKNFLGQHENQDKILLITIKLSENKNKNKELKNKL